MVEKEALSPGALEELGTEVLKDMVPVTLMDECSYTLDIDAVRQLGLNLSRFNGNARLTTNLGDFWSNYSANRKLMQDEEGGIMIRSARYEWRLLPTDCLYVDLTPRGVELLKGYATYNSRISDSPIIMNKGRYLVGLNQQQLIAVFGSNLEGAFNRMFAPLMSNF